MLLGFVSQYHQSISGRDVEYVSSLLGQHDLAALSNPYGAKNMLALRRQTYTGLSLVMVQKVTQLYVIELCQSIAVDEIR